MQGGRYLDALLATLVAENRELAARAAIAPRPLWVKIAPDLASDELDEVLAALLAAGAVPLRFHLRAARHGVVAVAEKTLCLLYTSRCV